MAIVEFRTFSDGVPAEMRRRDEYTTDTNLDQENLWVPYVPGVHFQACSFNVTSGGFANILRVQPGTSLPPHYHISTVHGYTLRGSWHYREHKWVAVPGTYIFETAGCAHTL